MTQSCYVKVLRSFLPLDEPLRAISPERAHEMYTAETRRARADGRPIAVDTHHKLLCIAKVFFAWVASRRYLDKNPFADVKPIGRPRRGKAQLRIDEARKFVAHALEAARQLDPAATAALLQIFLGLRPTEAVVRVVRDLDDGGRVLWIPFGKTANSRRRLQVPEVLREILVQHAAGKPAEAPLLGKPGEPMHTRQILNKRLPELCAAAGVPRVVPHSLRGLNATLALDAGATAQHVAAALGHASFSTTARHYADASTIANASLRRVADVLTAVERPSPAQVAALLREHLPRHDLVELAQLLAAEPSGSDGVRRQEPALPKPFPRAAQGLFPVHPE
jgi:integrase